MHGESITVEPHEYRHQRDKPKCSYQQTTIRENIIYIINVVVRTKKTISIKRVSVAEQVSIVQ